jgi:ABC-type glycerol-3-phosphate transport system substrate-binding protein
MIKIKKIVFIVLMIILNCNLLLGCSKGKDEPKGKLSILIQNNASQDVDVINTLIANYKKAHSQIEIKIENMTENEKIEKVTVDKPDYDVLICERNMMISMARQGYLSDISSNVSNNKMIDKFYSIVSTYGRIDDKYYGIGVMPYSLTFIYNRQQAAGYIKNSDEMDLMSLIRLSKEKNFKIPIALPKEMDISLAVASIIADNMINETDLEKNFDIGQDKYKKLTQMQEMFKFMNTLYKDYGVSADKFVLSDTSIVKKVESGEVPFALVTTLSSKEIDESKNIAVVNNNIIDGSKVNPPVVIDHLVCQLQNAKNKDEVVRFLDYLSDDESYKALGKEGIITGNRSANSELKGLQSQMIWPISVANENNIVFYHNLPYKMKPHIIEQTKNLINGVYSGKEWQTIVDKTYTEKK